MADHRTEADIAQEAREKRLEVRMDKVKEAWKRTPGVKWDNEKGEVDDDYHIVPRPAPRACCERARSEGRCAR